MGRFVTICLVGVCAATSLALASAAGSDDPTPVAPDGLLVLGVLSPERAMVADPRSGEIDERRLPGGTLCHGPVLAVGERVILAGSRGRRAVALSWPLTLTGPARSLGAADTFAPSHTSGRLWLGRGTEPRAEAARVFLREVDLDGRILSRTRELLPRWSMLHAALEGGFLITHGRWLSLWEPRFDRPLRSIRDGWLVAAQDARFAWCRGDCRRLRVWSPQGERTLDPPEGVRPQLGGDAAFSLDGGRLAMPVLTHRGARVGVVEVANGRWSVVPGAKLAGYQSIAWSPSGGWLYFTGGGPRLLAWRDGAQRPVRLPIRPGGTVMSIATVEAPGRGAGRPR
jgi:hypothetical protein